MRFAVVSDTSGIMFATFGITFQSALRFAVVSDAALCSIRVRHGFQSALRFAVVSDSSMNDMFYIVAGFQSALRFAVVSDVSNLTGYWPSISFNPL